MADVTVNIRGDASQFHQTMKGVEDAGKNIGNSSGGGSSAPSTGGSGFQSSDRMIEDVRREMQQRGVLFVPGSSSMTQVINQYGQSQKNIAAQEITKKYEPARQDLQKRMTEEYQEVDERLENRRREGILNLGSNANDPLQRKALESRINEEGDDAYERIGKKYDKEESDLDLKEKNEIEYTDKELTSAIKQLVDFFNKAAIEQPVSRATFTPNSRGVDGMLTDVDKISQTQGISSSEAINILKDRTTQENDSAITDKYNLKRQDLGSRRNKDFDDVDEKSEKYKNEALESLGDKANDPLYRKVVDKRSYDFEQGEYKKIDKKYDAEESELAEQEKSEKDSAEAELIAAIKELTEHFDRQSQQQGSTEDSYIGRLRTEQKGLIHERDSADDEAGARDASKRLLEVNEKLNSAMGGERPDKSGFSALQGSQGMMGMMSSAKDGNIGGTIMGGGTAIAGLSGMGMGSAMKFLGWIGALAGAVSVVLDAGDTYESLGDLSALRAPTPGLKGAKASESLTYNIPNMALSNGTKISDFGLSTTEFGSEATNRIKQRGSADDWFKESLTQIGLEKNLSLGKGDLGKGGEYDKYGINVTDAITRLVDVLSNIEGSGVSSTNFTRVQEKYDAQQQLMSSYKTRVDRPDFDTANQMVAGFSSIKGITQDDRIGSDMQQFQNVVQNPVNDRMKALVYNVVGDLFPETGGQIDKVKRKLADDKSEPAIIEAVVKRLMAQFGGMETKMGYLTMTSLFSGVAPERLEKITNQINEGVLTKDNLKGKLSLSGGADGVGGKGTKAEDLARESSELLYAPNKITSEMKNQTDRLISTMLGISKESPLAGIFKNNPTRNGSQR